MKPAPFWLVASADTVLRWGVALDRERLAYHPLAWSHIETVGDAAAWRARADAVRPDLVLLTSPNGARVLPDAFGVGLVAACVGETTAEEARRKGFDVRHVGRSTGADLARDLIAGEAARRILFFRGRDVRSEGTRLLEAAGWRVEGEVVYEARPRATFPAEVRVAPEPLGIALGSPRAADALAGALDARGRMDLQGRGVVAIGSTTAARLEKLGFGGVRAPAVPGVKGLVTCLRALLPDIDPSR